MWYLTCETQPHIIMGSLKENKHENYYFLVLNNEEYYVRVNDLNKVIKQNANLLKHTTRSYYIPSYKKKNLQSYTTKQDWKRIFNNWYKIENNNLEPILLLRNSSQDIQYDYHIAYLQYRCQHSRWNFAR